MLITSYASAQAFVYTPVNPSFGGPSFNSSHLLGIANAQNKYKDPEALARQNTSATDLFVRQLQSRLLSGLASQVTDAIFGDNPQESGQIVFGDQTITFNRGAEAIYLSIDDKATGSRTEIEIPVLTTPEAQALADQNALQLVSPNSQGQSSLLDPLPLN